MGRFLHCSRSIFLEKLIDLYKNIQTATIIAHPESETHILKVAHYIGSTSGMLNHVKTVQTTLLS